MCHADEPCSDGIEGGTLLSASYEDTSSTREMPRAAGTDMPDAEESGLGQTHRTSLLIEVVAVLTHAPIQRQVFQPYSACSFTELDSPPDLRSPHKYKGPSVSTRKLCYSSLSCRSSLTSAVVPTCFRPPLVRNTTARRATAVHEWWLLVAPKVTCVANERLSRSSPWLVIPQANPSARRLTAPRKVLFDAAAHDEDAHHRLGPSPSTPQPPGYLTSVHPRHSVATVRPRNFLSA